MPKTVTAPKKYDYRKVTTLKAVYEKHPAKVKILEVVKALEFLDTDLSRGMLATLNAQMLTYVMNNNDPKVPVFNPNYNDTNQYKYGPLCYGGDESGAGFRFGAYGWTLTFTFAYGGARLALRDLPRLQHVKKYFPNVVKEFFLMLKTPMKKK